MCALLGACMLIAGGCTRNVGVCQYDTDCAQDCYVCDPEISRCVLNPECDPDRACHSDLDCDAVLERCIDGECVHIGGDDDPDGDGDGGDGLPPDCENPDADCSEEGLPGQGRDRDNDLWGTCCDCDDTDPLVHPQRNELIYNGKDDDCRLDTPDDDLDRDGYDSLFTGGSDCEDRNANVHPGAEEFCDGLDNNCDGQIDPPDCTPINCDGGSCETDEERECPDMSGIYDITSHCLQIDSAMGVELVQNGCDLSFNLDAIYCTATLDAALNMYVECAGLGFPCTAKASLTSSFTIICSEQCTFIMVPVEGPTACTFHSDPDCTQDARVCGAVGSNGAIEIGCVDTLPGGREPGFFCNAGLDLYCRNSLCVDGACGAICEDDFHCAAFDGTTCQTVSYTDEANNQGDIPVCLPVNAGETRCGRSPDCSPTRVCTVRPADDDVWTVCQPPEPAGSAPGEACNAAADCANGLCICGDMPCQAGQAGFCSAICAEAGDCIQSHMCAQIYVPDLGGTDRSVPACVPDPNSCGHNADCPVGQSCQIWIPPIEPQVLTECRYGSGQAVDNTGEPCSNDIDCFSVWCENSDDYCVGVCISDADCPTYQDAPLACTDDAECTLQELCDTGQCQRPFECATLVFWLGYDPQGQEVWDTVDACRPVQRPCDLNADCRAGEACSLQIDVTGTQAAYACLPGLGPGQPGDDCAAGGAAACFTGLCIRVGEGGPGNEYCSQSCVVDDDCGDPATWACQAVRVDIRPGYVSYVPACIQR